MPNTESFDSLLGGFEPVPGSPHSLTIQKALFVARSLQERARALQTSSERRQQAELDRMLQTPSDKATLALMTDQAFRTSDPARAVEHLTYILDVQGVPRFFGPIDRTLMKGFQSFGAFVPGVALPLVKEHMQKETANVILPGEKEVLTQHLAERRTEGVRMNVNFLGEAVLSEAESERRLQQYLQGLQWPETEVVSIKISTLYSQISPLAREHTVSVLCDRLERLFRTADRARFIRPDGVSVPKFVYLDMEEYRDKELTAAAFMRTLDRDGLQHVRAGIALQSYIPDSFRTLLQLQEWARRRVADGGGRITIRLVKGANMESERAESSVRGWPQAPYQTKLETDANYKRMVHEVLKPENLAAMDVGVASHNLFDLAYGLVLAHERNALDKVQFEMLEGMANAQRRALFELSRNLLLYAPACRKENFINAIGYLIRRLDENTGPENFLRHAFKIEVDSPEWRQLEQGFLAAFDAIPRTSDAPRRNQDRNVPPVATPALARGWQQLECEPDTDFALPQNGEWVQKIVAKWQARCGAAAVQVPLVIAGEEVLEGRTVRDCLDPSRPGVVVGRYRQATDADVARAADCAAEDPDGWRTMPVEQRFELLGKVAQELRIARGDLIGAALADGGKTPMESDPEVSEAIDFLEFYRDTARWWQQMPTLKARPEGRRRRGAAVELPDGHPLRRRRGRAGGGQHGHHQARFRRRARRMGDVPVLLARGRFEEGAAVPAVLRRQGRPQARQQPESQRGDPDRRHGDRADDAGRQSAPQPVCRDRRQGRDDRHGGLGSRPGHQAHPALGLQSRRPEMLRDVAAAAAVRGLRRPGVPALAVRSRAEPEGRLRLGTRHQDGPVDPAALGRPRNCAESPRAR